MIDKTIPDKTVIDFLTQEIKEFGIPFAKGKPNLCMTKTSFDKFKNTLPKMDLVPKAALFYGTHDMKRVESANIQGVIKHMNQTHCTNTLYYSAGSCLNWHTNSDNVGIRTYILYTSKPGIFRYKDPFTGKIIDDEDYVGWTQRTFKVGKENLLWHCVYSPAPRFAYGFNNANTI
jgi:hypothetical protein